ncbi:MAG: SPOR domain-containing protein [Muribaculum sp.]|nr:SPOR domain-containing protein [Muribaculum sp.]
MKHSLTSHTQLAKLLVICLLTWLAAPVCLFGQTVNSSESTATTPQMLQRIEEESEGNVTFDIPENIADRIFQTPSAPKKATQHTSQPTKVRTGKMNGFRIQVFNDSHNQGTLQARAKARGNAIAAKFPKYRGQIYTFSSSPSWYTRIGNFRTQSEATAAMQELKRAFPAFAGEMRVVKSQVIILR